VHKKVEKSTRKDIAIFLSLKRFSKHMKYNRILLKLSG